MRVRVHPHHSIVAARHRGAVHRYAQASTPAGRCAAGGCGSRRIQAEGSRTGQPAQARQAKGSPLRVLCEWCAVGHSGGGTGRHLHHTPIHVVPLRTRLSLEELVVLGDSLLRRNVLHERYTLQDFEDMLVRIEHYAHNPRSGRARAPRGMTACRKALVLMQEHTDSSTETRLRLMLECHGLPRPTVNHMVRLPDGGVVFMDIAFVKAQVDVEYDGKHHEQQWEADAQRRLRIESAGWDYVQVVNCSMSTEKGQRMVAEVVARHIEDRTGVNYLLPTPFTLEQLADRRRMIWKTAA